MRRTASSISSSNAASGGRLAASESIIAVSLAGSSILSILAVADNLTLCMLIISSDVRSEPCHHLMLQPARAGLAEVEALREVDVAARLDPHGRERLRGPGDGRYDRLGGDQR